MKNRECHRGSKKMSLNRMGGGGRTMTALLAAAAASGASLIGFATAFVPLKTASPTSLSSAGLSSPLPVDPQPRQERVKQELYKKRRVEDVQGAQNVQNVQDGKDAGQTSQSVSKDIVLDANASSIVKPKRSRRGTIAVLQNKLSIIIKALEEADAKLSERDPAMTTVNGDFNASFIKGEFNMSFFKDILDSIHTVVETPRVDDVEFDLDAGPSIDVKDDFDASGDVDDFADPFLDDFDDDDYDDESEKSASRNDGYARVFRGKLENVDSLPPVRFNQTFQNMDGSKYIYERRGDDVYVTTVQDKPRRLRPGATTSSTRSSYSPPLTMSPPFQICLMVEPTPFTHVSGYSNRFKEYIKNLRKAGDLVKIITTDATIPPDKVPTHTYGFPITHTRGAKFVLYKQISVSSDLEEKSDMLLENWRPDIIHVTSPGFMVFKAIELAQKHKIPLVMSYHTHLPAYGKKYLGFIPFIERAAWKVLKGVHACADLTLVTSAQMMGELRDQGISNVEVWRKGIDTDRFHPRHRNREMRSRMTDGNPDDFIMMYVGRLGEEKRLKDMREIQLSVGPRARICFVGSGPYTEELKRFYEGTNTVFTGQLGGTDLSQAFASADVFVMPSDSETLGFVVLEAMASGVPVVAANAGGIPDIIQGDYYSFLVNPGDAQGFAQKIREFQDNPSYRELISQRAREEAERWGWEGATSYLRNVQYDKARINFAVRREAKYGRRDFDYEEQVQNGRKVVLKKKRGPNRGKTSSLFGRFLRRGRASKDKDNGPKVDWFTAGVLSLQRSARNIVRQSEEMEDL